MIWGDKFGLYPLNPTVTIAYIGNISIGKPYPAINEIQMWSIAKEHIINLKDYAAKKGQKYRAHSKIDRPI